MRLIHVTSEEGNDVFFAPDNVLVIRQIDLSPKAKTQIKLRDGTSFKCEDSATDIAELIKKLS